MSTGLLADRATSALAVKGLSEKAEHRAARSAPAIPAAKLLRPRYDEDREERVAVLYTTAAPQPPQPAGGAWGPCFCCPTAWRGWRYVNTLR